jgi:hypothetical protein
MWVQTELTDLIPHSDFSHITTIQIYACLHCYFIIRGKVHMYVDTTVVWNVLYTADNCKLENGDTGDRHNGNGLPFLDTQPELCNRKITWNLTLQTAPLLTLQFHMHDRSREVGISTNGMLSNYQMHAVESSFNDDSTAPPIVATNNKPEIHTAFRWISANISDLQCINTQRGQVCLSQNQNFVSTWIII